MTQIIKRKLKTLLLLIIIFSIVSGNVAAQDKQSNSFSEYIPLFDNLKSQNADSINAQYNSTLKVAVPQTYTDINESEIIPTIKSLYSAGKYREVIEVAQNNKKQFKKRDSLTQQYMKFYLSALKETKHDEQADSMVKKFRHEFPFYIVKNNDPIPFVDLMTNFNTRPLFSIGCLVTKSYPLIYLKEVYQIPGNKLYKSVEYSNIKLYSAELFLQYNTFKKISFSLGFAWQQLHYNIIDTLVKATEYHNFMQIPFKILYSSSKTYFKRFSHEYYVEICPAFTYNHKFDVSTIERVGFLFINDRDTTTTKFEDKSKYFNTALRGGIRFNVTVKRIVFFVDARFGYWLQPINDNKNRYPDTKFLLSTNYVPDRFKMLDYGFSLGFKININYKTYAKYNYGY